MTAKEEGDNPNVTSLSDNAMLDRQQGYKMLGFINGLARASNWIGKAPGRKRSA
ncbi:hypothetical protein [Solirubrum puertoriconensis]|uniref:hypothetical protein n=1 Tax=Solirubrum puertoriconensis TaxID=1751427 RepID=UPI0013657B97|nr:hypothetical protein [Solirubrum puertoriconensis]